METHGNRIQAPRPGEHQDATHEHRHRDMTFGLIVIIVMGYLFLLAFVTFNRLITILLPEYAPPLSGRPAASLP
ncbi:hypothetical protein [Methylacidimicrobium sp. AP8]|uniref:hypothetical protein n=1 Tax=Methylacidimicrobium sp. AP8 TaxID=2730359 RepID=UPI001921972C|nr:hypothetical protein [Methylacidimicrobium sp. AP8]